MVRRDLPAGLQAAQACHALRQFVEEHPALDHRWFERSNRLVLLAADHEAALRELLAAAGHRGIHAAAFREPDLDHSLTAITLEPHPATRRLCRRLPLGLSPP